MLRQSLCLTLLTLSCTAPTVVADAPWTPFPTGSTVAVLVRSGRLLRGQIDPRTDSRHLWLVAETEGIRVGSRLGAAEVVRIDPGAAVKLPPRWPVAPTVAAAPTLQSATPNNPAREAVKSLAIVAHLENWDGDAQPDGLRLYVAPRNARGELTPVAGSVSIRLAVWRGDWRDRQGRFREEEFWSRQIAGPDFGPHGAVLDLPFHKIDPEADRELLPVGTLSVRLNVAGLGTFDATAEDVELHSAAFTRELPLRPSSARRYDTR